MATWGYSSDFAKVCGNLFKWAVVRRKCILVPRISAIKTEKQKWTLRCLRGDSEVEFCRAQDLYNRKLNSLDGLCRFLGSAESWAKEFKLEKIPEVWGKECLQFFTYLCMWLSSFFWLFLFVKRIRRLKYFIIFILKWQCIISPHFTSDYFWSIKAALWMGNKTFKQLKIHHLKFQILQL